jgi:hypothetical protein
VFLVGVSLTLSWQTQLVTRGRIFERGLLIICLGLFMAGFPFFNPFRWRFPGRVAAHRSLLPRRGVHLSDARGT